MESIKTDDMMSYTFAVTKAIKFGEAVFVLGSVASLGEWEISKAVRMVCRDEKEWIIARNIPMDIRIEYKFFVAAFDFVEQGSISEQVGWIGEGNEVVSIPSNHRQKFEKRGMTEYAMMSFNVLHWTPETADGEISWKNRREKVIISSFSVLRLF
jgi:hypothetical protein